MKKQVFATLLFLSILIGSAFVQVPSAHATNCSNNPYEGTWTNPNPEKGIVTSLRLKVPCISAIDIPVGKDYVRGVRLVTTYVTTRCPQGECSWGASPIQWQNEQFVDHRFFLNGTARQQIKLLQDGRLRITTETSPNNGNRQRFVDYLQKQSNDPDLSDVRIHTELLIQRANTRDTDACSHDNELYMQLLFTGGVNTSRKTQIIEEQQAGWINPMYARPPWKIAAKAPYEVGSVDAILKLKEDDDFWCGGDDDHYDISPDSKTKNLHIRIYFESGEIYLVTNGKPTRYLGRATEDIFVKGNSKNAGEITFKVYIGYLPRYLSPPKTVSNSPTNSPVPASQNSSSPSTPSKQQERQAPTVRSIPVTLPKVDNSCARPHIVYLRASAPPAGSTATFTLHYLVNGADIVEIFGNKLNPSSGTFDVFEDKPANWILWAKAKGTADNCYAERGIHVIPGGFK